MKIVLWIFHEAGYRTLRKLYAKGHKLLVITEKNPSHIPSVIELAKSLGLPIYVGASDDLMRDKITEFQPDLGISMYYPRILKKEILKLPAMGAFNFHPSLLPRHRGCFSAPWAILEGDKETGVTCHEMVEEVDRGRVLCQSHVNIATNDTAYSLYYKLVDSAVNLLEAALIKISESPISLEKQVEGGSYHRRELPYKGQINLEWPSEKIERFIRAMYFPPHPPAQLIVGEASYSIHSMNEYRQLVRDNV